MKHNKPSNFSFQINRRVLATALSALLLGPAMCASALAQAWPSKPIKVVVNFPPGGAADQIARAIGIPLAEALSCQGLGPRGFCCQGVGLFGG